MPTLDWIGKPAVIRHHAEVPFHLLKEEPELSCGGEAGAGNLIVQGDNLKALKALLPHYGGQVKCIYIDPPYNTGNEGWVYNDNVNSPEMKRWLESVVGKEGEDLTRHDKWLCMMYPRLMLLKRFLRDDGAIFVSLDDNEIGPLRLIMDEIFGQANFVGTLIWQKSYAPRNNVPHLSASHEYVVCYSRSIARLPLFRLPPSDEMRSRYKNPDADPRGDWKPSDLSVSLVSGQRGAQYQKTGKGANIYPITTPNGRTVNPPNGRCWVLSLERFNELVADNRIWWGTAGNSIPQLKRFFTETQASMVPETIWEYNVVGHMQEASQTLKDLFADNRDATFPTPKTIGLIQRILQIATNPGDLILDSFAGSGTTGHAVLKMNFDERSESDSRQQKIDSEGGTELSQANSLPPRRFILVEMDENIAQNITAERVRRVSQGYANAKGEEVPGIGSGFRFAKLGKTLFDETGAIRDDVKFRELAEFVYFHHTGSPIPQGWKKSPLLGIVDGRAIYLLYNGILADRSIDGGNVLTGPVLAELPAHDGPKTIYAAACRLGPSRLERERIQFKQTPYALRVD